MRNGEWSKVVKVAGRILLAFLFVFPQSTWAGQDPKAKDNARPAQKAAVQQTGEKPAPMTTPTKTETEEGQAESSGKSTAEVMPTGNGSHEGIKVHGHWTIEVRNPDGSVVTRREFENSLVSTGSPALVALLSQQATMGIWYVQLVPSAGVALTIFELGGSPTPPGTSNNLVVTNGGTSLTLSGSVTTSSAVQIATVQTLLFTCVATAAAASCGAGGIGGTSANPLLFGNKPLLFTQTSPPPVSVQNGQIVQVSVVISFS
jgi:hypothetical protein